MTEAFYKLSPGQSFAWIDDKFENDSDIFWPDTNIGDPPLISEILSEANKIANKVPMSILRNQRNSMLSQTDWWASSDLTMTAEQTAYRKALRDLPSTASPELDSDGELIGVTWPTKPE